MEEVAKTEARNYLAAAGFFLLGGYWLLFLISSISNNTFTGVSNETHIALGIGLLAIATLLFILKKRDMIGILFVMLAFWQLFCAFSPASQWKSLLTGFILLVILVTMTSKDSQKWFYFLIPLFFFIICVLWVIFGFNVPLFIIFHAILIFLCFYYAFCFASERIRLPGSKLLTADEQTDFKASGSVLGYMLFALISGGYAIHYLLGETVLPMETFVPMEILCGVLMIFVAILLLVVGKMRFTPVMFILLGITSILCLFSTGLMFIGTGILMIIIGLFAVLRKESRILPGIMLIVYGSAEFFTAYSSGSLISAPVVSVILNAIPCLIAIYLSFVVYSQRKLPKF